MEVEDMGELSKFETVPNEQTFVIAVVHYESGGGWAVGPSGARDYVMSMLPSWSHIDKARIYSVKLPVDKPLGA